MQPRSKWTLDEIKKLFIAAIKKLNKIKKLNIAFEDADYLYVRNDSYKIRAWWIDEEDGSRLSNDFMWTLFDVDEPTLGIDSEIGAKSTMSLEELAILRIAYWIWKITNRERGS